MTIGYKKLDVRLNKLLAANGRVHGFDDPVRADAGKNTLKAIDKRTKSVMRVKNGLNEFADCQYDLHAALD